MAIISKSNSANSIKNDDKQFDELFFQMKDLYTKLMLVDYSKEFVTNYKCPPIHRYYFVKPLNQAQQFFTFCSLSSYLINKLNNNNDFKVDSFDDPNLTVEKILKASQKFATEFVQKFIGQNNNSERQKLKQGYGSEVIELLMNLVNKLWIEKYQNDSVINSSKIEIILRNSDGALINEEDLDDDGDEIEEDDDNEIELEEEFEDYLDTESDLVVQDDGWQDEESMILDESLNQDKVQQRQMLITQIDPNEWRMELERVLPQINSSRFIMNPSMMSSLYDGGEWRIHLQAAKRHHSQIEMIFQKTEGMLQQIQEEIHGSLDKIRSKEIFLHENCATILAEWINVRKRALDLEQSLNESNEEIRQKSLRLQELSEEDKQTKQSIEEFSLKITDSSPLAEAKKAKEMLKQELTRVNLQIGVAVQTLVRHISLHSTYA